MNWSVTKGRNSEKRVIGGDGSRRRVRRTIRRLAKYEGVAEEKFEEDELLALSFSGKAVWVCPCGGATQGETKTETNR